jgi:hypothetical protein
MAVRGSISRRRLEELLEQVLVPVEPDLRFVRRLRARLVHYQGTGMGPLWMLVFGLAVATVVAVASLGLTLRVLLGFLGLLGIVTRRQADGRKGSRHPTQA